MESQKKQVTGYLPADEDNFYQQWGYETLKNNIVLLNDVLRQLLTLDTALLAAAIGFFDKIETLSWSKSTVLILLCISLVMSFLGIFPYEGKVDIRNITMIRRHKEKAQLYKRIFLGIAAGVFILSFVLLLLNLVIE